MNTSNAEHESALQALRTDMKQLDADMANRDSESARRERENFRWLIGLSVATVIVLGVLARWPA